MLDRRQGLETAMTPVAKEIESRMEFIQFSVALPMNPTRDPNCAARKLFLKSLEKSNALWSLRLENMTQPLNRL